MNSTQKSLLEMVLREANNSPEFAEALRQGLEGKAVKAVGSAKKVRLEPVDLKPIREYRKDPEGLRVKLKGLTEAQLRQVIRQEGMDTARRTTGWGRDKLVEHILGRAKARATQGDVFLNYK